MPIPPTDPPADRRDPPTRYRFGAFVLDLARRELRRGDAVVDMPARVFECLEALLRHRDRAVGRDELLQAVFRRADVSDGQLAQVILRARRCVDDDGNAQHTIRTVPRYGFRWVADTVAVAEPDVASANSAAAASPVAISPAVASTAVASTAVAGPDVQADGLVPPHAPDAVDGDGDGETGIAAAADRVAPAPASAPAPAPAPAPAIGAVPSGTPPISRPRRTGRIRIAVAIAGLLAIAAAGGWFATRGDRTAAATAAADAPAAVAAPTATVVLPARVTGGDDTAWVRLGLMDFLAERLRLAGLSVPPSENTLVILRGGGRAAADTFDAGDVALRDRLGAGVLVAVEAGRNGALWRVRLQAAGRDGWRNASDGEAPDLLAAARIASDRLLAAMGRDAPAGQSPIDIDERLQRVRAAILANELDAARAILRETPAGEVPAPRMRYYRAQVDYRAGDIAAARREIDALLAGDPADFADPRFHARLLILRASTLFRGNAVAEAARDFDTALAALAGIDADLERGIVLSGRAVTRSVAGDATAAFADYGAARTHLERAGDRLGVARVDANTGAFEVSRGRPAVAMEYLERALAVFEPAAAMNEQQTTRSTLVEAHLMRLDAEGALAIADRAIALLPRTHDPNLRLAAHLDRAGALVALGRLGEARRLLESPDLPREALAQVESQRAVVAVELAWQSGDAARVVAIADAALPNIAPVDAARRDWVRLRRAQAARRVDMPARDDGRIEPADADAPIALLVRAVSLDDAVEAEAAFRDALAMADGRSNPSETVEIVVAWVDRLLDQGRTQDAAALVGRVAGWSDRCFDCARLQWRLATMEGDRAAATTALGRMRALAGERRLPPGANDAR